MPNKTILGHLAALLTILVWGTTFISTKVLLTVFQPVEILFIRFVLGFLALCLAAPRRFRTAGPRQEAVFALAGLSGICLYYLLENIALTYTLASNVGVIISIAPFFTAMLAHRFLHTEKALHARFFAGFLAAMCGILLISFSGRQLALNPLGDALAVAAFVWAMYSLLTRTISRYGYPVLLTTRRTFFYGLLFMLPALLLSGFHPSPAAFATIPVLANLLYLGLGASALCFVTWNFAVKELGAVKTSVYIYAVPVITVLTSALILHEPLTLRTGLGTVLTLAGLLLSESKPKKENTEHESAN